eukprot:CAMPEP_0113478590 /NCGR_PEP_ID=MMETSP0014_2-20120614/20839_1 /TAXON_ID=2857 /ORGANISM="Nitzschia sp." /LENGTH=349 /DNA_ID=CAMNT_0000371795 /DNA_START=91 /DNA_END=1140 /DNA_ORIENTATION=+ /assembly_acc=CAM_ASM_000159
MNIVSKKKNILKLSVVLGGGFLLLLVASGGGGTGTGGGVVVDATRSPSSSSSVAGVERAHGQRQRRGATNPTVPVKQSFPSSTTICKSAPPSSLSRRQQVNLLSQDRLLLRGGARADCDSDKSLFAKLGASAVLETSLMLLALVGSAALSDQFPGTIPSMFNLPVTQLVAAFCIIFASSFFGSLVEDKINAATNQVLAPNVIPGNSEKWYANLKKPSWNPPGYMFPIMWLLVSKPTQLCAVSRILKYGTSFVDGKTELPLGVLGVYCFHLALGDTWNKVFFGLQCPGRGSAVISMFFGCLLLSTFLFYSLDETAGYYMLPTCGWVAVATALQWNIYLNNKPKTTIKKKK